MTFRNLVYFVFYFATVKIIKKASLGNMVLSHCYSVYIFNANYTYCPMTNSPIYPLQGNAVKLISIRQFYQRPHFFD